MDDALGHGSFGMVCKGRLNRLTTPAAEYLQLTPSSTSGGTDGTEGTAGAGGAPTDLPEGASWAQRSKAWLLALLARRRGREAESSSTLGVDVAVKVRALWIKFAFGAAQAS